MNIVLNYFKRSIGMKKYIIFFLIFCARGSICMKGDERLIILPKTTINKLSEEFDALNENDLFEAVKVLSLQKEKKQVDRNYYRSYEKLMFKKMSITDDKIAAALKNPPPSISDVLVTVRKKSIPERNAIKVLNLSRNSITNDGAVVLFNEIIYILPNLEILDLSNNNLRDLRGNEGYSQFETALRNILHHSTLKQIKLKTNSFSILWYMDIKNKMGEYADKIKIQ